MIENFPIFSLSLLLNVLKSVLVILGAYIFIKIFSKIRIRVENRFKKANHREEQIVQIDTFMTVSEYIIRITIIFVAGIWILSIFGVNILPVLTTVGVAGLAVSLSAQTIIKDYFGGMVILVENLYYVGDTITIGSNSGRVLKITLRSTYLVDTQQNLIIIPNGDIRTIVKIDEKKRGEPNVK